MKFISQNKNVTKNNKKKRKSSFMKGLGFLCAFKTFKSNGGNFKAETKETRM